MAQAQHTPEAELLEEAITTLFCELDDAYRILNPRPDLYASLKKLSDSEVITLAIFQQLRGVESERSSCLREVARFFGHLFFPKAVGLHPSSFHRRLRKLRRFLEPFRRAVVPEVVGDPESVIVDSTLLEVLHPRQVPRSAGFDGAAWVRWGTFSVYGVKLHMLRATNRVPISYELTTANTAEVRLTEELSEEANLWGRRWPASSWRISGLPQRGPRGGSGRVGDRVGNRRGQSGRRPGVVRQQIEIRFSSLKRSFGLGETLATTLVGLATRIAAEITAYTYAFYINRLLGRPQGRIKELWA